MKFALITGASSGIGLEMAKIMAAEGKHLILVARRKEILLQLKEELEQKNDISVEVVEMDLAQPQQAQKLFQYCQDHTWQVDCLVNNAGYGDYGKLDVSKLAVYQNMLQLNIVALTELTALFAHEMKARGYGRILNVGSIAAFQPGPNLAAYAASKAYVMQFTEAVNYEMRGTGVTVTLLSPGVTETGFVARANMQSAANAKNGLMSAHDVAMAGYKAMMAGKLNVIPGWKNAVLAFGSKSLPFREILLRIAGSILKDSKAS